MSRCSREGRKAFPESWEIATAQAQHLERRGAFEEALAAAQDAARLAPFRPEGWGALAAIRGILGPKEEASDGAPEGGAGGEAAPVAAREAAGDEEESLTGAAAAESRGGLR